MGSTSVPSRSVLFRYKPESNHITCCYPACISSSALRPCCLSISLSTARQCTYNFRLCTVTHCELPTKNTEVSHAIRPTTLTLYHSYFILHTLSAFVLGLPLHDPYISWAWPEYIEDHLVSIDYSTQ